LGKAFDLTVVVTYNGEPIEGAPVNSGTSYGNYYGYSVKHVTTDSNGIAIIKGLDRRYPLDIWVPAFDADGDGIYDYVDSGNNYPAYYPDLVGETISKALTEAKSNDVKIISSNANKNHDASFYIKNYSDLAYMSFGFFGYGNNNYYDYNYTTEENYRKNGINSFGHMEPIIYVFNFPIAFNNGDLTVTWRDYLVNPDANGDGVSDANFSVENKIVGATFSIDSTGTILTIKPPVNGWPKVNSLINISGTVSALHSNRTVSLDEDAYIENDSPSGLSQQSVITVGSNSNQGNVCLQFPEYVYGKITIEATKPNGSASWTSQDNNTMNIYSGDLIYSDGTAYAFSGVFFAVNLNGYPYYVHLNKNDIVRIKFDVQDVAGNRFTGTKDLTVQ
jgi:hypothetical protein